MGSNSKFLEAQAKDILGLYLEPPKNAAILCVDEKTAMQALDRSQPALLKDAMGIGYCNITKCCTEVCPEEIHITDNAIIPLKERVVDEFYDPIKMLFRKFSGA